MRAALVLRLNALLKGFSGVRVELVNAIAAMINAGIVPLVPTRGSVGSSGDLCPLAHLFVVMLGQGRFYLASDPAWGNLRDGSSLRPVSTRPGRAELQGRLGADERRDVLRGDPCTGGA